MLIDGVTQLARVAFLWGQVDVGDGMRIAQYPPGGVPLDIAILWGVIVLFSGLCFTLRVRKTLVCYGGMLAVQSALTVDLSMGIILRDGGTYRKAPCSSAHSSYSYGTNSEIMAAFSLAKDEGCTRKKSQ